MSEDQQIQEAVEEVLPEGPSTGKVLAEARERIGLSVADAARQLRLSPRQIEALEADDYARLPGKTFLRGFIRNYARLLQIDPEPLLAGCFEAIPQTQSIVVPSSRVEFGGKRRLLPFGDKPQRPWMQILAVGVAAIVIVSWAGYELSQRQPVESESKTVAETPVLKGGEETTLALPLPQPQAEPTTAVPAAAQAPEPAPVPAPVAPAPVAPMASSPPAPASVSMPAGVPAETVKPAAEGTGPRFQFIFNGDSWVEVRDRNGKVLFSQLNPKGSQQLLRLGQPPFALVVGNAAQVRLSYNDKPIDLTPHTKIDVARLTIE